MNDFLKQVEKGKQEKPPVLMVHGEHGSGKTGFIASMNANDHKVLLADIEDGSRNYDLDRVKLADKTFPAIMSFLHQVRDGQHEYTALGIDSLDFIERKAVEHVVDEDGARSIDTAHGGYGRGWRVVNSHMKDLLHQCMLIREQRGMVVVFTSHSEIKRVEHPEHPAFDRVTPRLNKLNTDLFCESVDAVLFCHRRMAINKVQDGSKARALAVGVGSGDQVHVFRAVAGPACVAKNRLGIPEGDHQLSWGLFVSLCH